jgi:hypothetical protein
VVKRNRWAEDRSAEFTEHVMNAPRPISDSSQRAIDLELLTRRARRAYELGRLRAASRILWLLVPLVTLAAAIGRRTELCSCVGAVLVGAAVFARWRGRALGDALTHGVLVGAFVTVTGLSMNALLARCSDESLVSLCGVICALSGIIGGYSLFRLSGRVEVSRVGKHLSIAIATVGVTALLGCFDLSREQSALLAAGLLGVSAAGFLVRRSRHVATPS